MWARISVNSSNIEENRAQIIYPLRVHFCTFLRPPRSYISELATAVFTQVLFVLSNHSRGLTCLASVFHRKNRCAQICRNDASKTVAVQLMTSSREELVPKCIFRFMSTPLMVDNWSSLSKCHEPHSATNQLGEYGGIRKENEQENVNHMMTNTSWKDSSTSKLAQGMQSHQAYTRCGQNSSTLQRKSFWDVPGGSSCSWCLHYTLWNCWSKPLPDSGASAQPRNQIKNQRENSCRLGDNIHFMTVTL